MSGAPFVWYELMTTDSAAAEAFYGSVVGWRGQDAGIPGQDYRTLSIGDSMVGGIMALPQEAASAGLRSMWIGYVGVDDADATAARIASAGGRVHRAPADIPGIGRFAIVADPQGAMFALFQGGPDMPRPEERPCTPGHPGWHELLAADGPAAFDFYAELFGWTKGEAFDMGPMGVYQLFVADTAPIGGMMTKPEAVPAPTWIYYFGVDGIDAAIERVGAAGGTVVNGPMQVPGDSWIIQGTDPQGALFALLSRTH